MIARRPLDGAPACLRLFGAAALALWACFGLDPRLSLSQANAQTIIQLPDTDPGDTLPPVEALSNLEDRTAPARRGFDTVAQEGFSNWVSPLRLTDLSILSSGQTARVSGEREVVRFDLYAGAGSAPRQLKLVTQSSINILPERSQMRVAVNGVDLGVARLDKFDGFLPTLFDLPDDVLIPGRNRVEIEFRQGHRIFCGPEASFDLWTDIDLTQSGLLVDHSRIGLNADSFMMALAAQVASTDPVEIRGLDRIGVQADAFGADLVRRFNQALVGAPVVFRFSDYWTAQQEQRAFARITILPAESGRVSFRIGGDGAQVMVLEVAPGSSPDALLADIAAFQPQAAAARAPLVTPGRIVPLSDFGVQTESFSQRYAYRSYPFRLPDDWLVLTAAKARINLDYIYAHGLPRASMLLLSVNGTAIRLLPLRDEGGTLITEFPIDFEARLLHPGTNKLSFEVMVPGDPPDLPCPAADRPFLQVSDTSTLYVPYSPSMAIPDMDLAFSALTPASIRTNELTARAYSAADLLTLSAALSRAQADTRPAVLHLISIDDLSSVPAAHHRADRRLLEDVVLALPDVTPVLQDPALAYVDDPFARRRQGGGSMLGGLRAALSNSTQAVLDGVYWLRDRIFPSSGDQLNQWLSTRRGQVVLFHLDPTRPEEIWMLRSPDADMHVIAQSFAAARVLGSGPRGQVSILGEDGGWDNWIAPDRQPILLEPWSTRNFRFAMGNFVSARPIFYTLIVLFLALLSALVALRLVISTREHKT